MRVDESSLPCSRGGNKLGLTSLQIRADTYKLVDTLVSVQFIYFFTI